MRTTVIASRMRAHSQAWPPVITGVETMEAQSPPLQWQDIVQAGSPSGFQHASEAAGSPAGSLRGCGPYGLNQQLAAPVGSSLSAQRQLAAPVGSSASMLRRLAAPVGSSVPARRRSKTRSGCWQPLWVPA